MALKGNAATPVDPSTPELHLMVDWQEPVTGRRIAIAAAGSLVFHFLALTVAGNLPEVPLRKDGPIITLDLKKAVPLYIPKELTQRDPNAGKVTKTLDVRSSAPPAPVPQAPRFRPPEPVPVQTPSIPAPAIEAPKVEAAAPPPPAPSGGIPQVQPPVEKPKLAFESVGAPGPSPKPNPNPGFQLPKPSAVEPQMSASVRPSQGSSGVVIGDVDEFSSAPIAGQTSSSGPVRSNLQLLSDPKGVDFKPYLVQVLTAVRTNWLAVIPESARFGGRKGRVLVQFIIDRKGAVPKLVIAESSGTAAFDRAAVAGISASYPFPPLPTGFQGEEIRLQLAFSYNVPSR